MWLISNVEMSNCQNVDVACSKITVWVVDSGHRMQVADTELVDLLYTVEGVPGGVHKD